ncbi:MAG: hypothetical protein V7776_03300 [Halopseudomonas aestusnigri]
MKFHLNNDAKIFPRKAIYLSLFFVCFASGNSLAEIITSDGPVYLPDSLPAPSGPLEPSPAPTGPIELEELTAPTITLGNGSAE